MNQPTGENKMYEAIAEQLKDQVTAIIPEFYTVRVRYSPHLSESIQIIIADMRDEACKVTYHNSDSFVQLIMHLNSSNPAWEKLCGNGIKFRKLSAPSITKANKRLMAWLARIFV